MPRSIHIAAIDAGSNAIRMMIARAASPSEVFILKKMRCSVRLGRHVFTRKGFDRETMNQAVHAFEQFSDAFEEYGIRKYRAVATSATRESANRAELIEKIYGETGILLEVIDGTEEAALIRSAVLSSLGPGIMPEVIADLGGGSLEISLMEGGKLARCLAIPAGAVRLMETLGIEGAINDKGVDKIKRRVTELLREHVPRKLDLAGSIAVATGGNAESLARIAPGFHTKGHRTLDLKLLARKMDDLLPLNVEQRMKTYGIRRDRAEVIAIAALVFKSLAQWFNLRYLLVPGVGVREGALKQLVDAHFKAEKSNRAEKMLDFSL